MFFNGTAAADHNGPPSALDAASDKVQAIARQVTHLLENVQNLAHAARAPLNTGTGDGSELDEPTPELLEKITQSLSDISHMDIYDAPKLCEVLEQKVSGDPIDDKTYLMEYVIQTSAELPIKSKLGRGLTRNFLKLLWEDLEHPPQSYLGQEHRYRKPDGSHNSFLYPDLGKAGTPYARSVKPSTPQSAVLPDPGVIFDSIMARPKEEENPDHPNQISSMLFYIASIIIHDAFRTDRKDFNISNTSSYLDLAPLYGSNHAEQQAMRTLKDGKLKPDCFSEKRLLAFPPGVGCILIMFNRFHNYVVDNLASINENGRFNKPGPGVPPSQTDQKRDEDLFQTARLITCGLYINIILIDYVRTILNLNQTNSKWRLDPRAFIKDGPQKGCGNQVSAEFNLVYRWHSAISTKDEKWMNEDLWPQWFPDKKPEEVGWHEFIVRAGHIENKLEENPQSWPFAGLDRKENGTFDDDALVEILTNGIEDCAHSFGPRKVPPVMRSIEILGMMQARKWELATLNEFRRHFKLESHKTFADISPDVATELEQLYDHPDRVELYPGLVVESEKKAMCPGSGLCPSYTISRAVLSDAVALVRGDRFYTTDYHPKQLTNWGYSEVDYDTELNNGCVMYKLFLRAFPNHFKQNSIYAHFPMTVPKRMKEALKELSVKTGDDLVGLYDWEKPKATPFPTLVTSHSAAKDILSKPQTFQVTWGPAMKFLMGDPAKDFMLAGDSEPNAESRKMMGEALYDVTDWDRQVRRYYEEITRDLLKARQPDGTGKSWKLGPHNYVDIIRDVGNMAHVHFCADLFFLPLKTLQNPHGLFKEKDLYMIMSAVFICIFFDLDPANSFKLHVNSKKATQALGNIVQANVWCLSKSNTFSPLIQWIFGNESPLKDYGSHLIARLLQSNKEMSVKDLVWGHILGTAGGMVANQGQLFGQALDYFFTEGQTHISAMRKLAHEAESHDVGVANEAFDKLMHYFMEASRLYGETGVFRYASEDTETVDCTGKTVKVPKDGKIMVNLKAASRDPEIFPKPDTFDLERPLDSYIHLGMGRHQCLGLQMTRVALTTMLKEIMKLEGLEAAPGPQGKVQKVLVPFPGEEEHLAMPESWHYHKYMTEMGDGYWPFPCSMKVRWNADGPKAQVPTEATLTEPTSNEPAPKEPETNGHVANGEVPSLGVNAHVDSTAEAPIETWNETGPEVQ